MHAEVLIVGAGPVGLFLAGLLAARGQEVTVLERRERPREHSRAIGLHPPALDALAVLGLDRAAVAEGLAVRRGIGEGDGRLLGEMTFERAHPRRPFVLTLPQSRTERLLAEHLERLAPGALHRGVEVVELDQPSNDDGGPVRVSVRPVGESVAEAGAGDEVWTADVVVAADGAHSTVRRLVGIGTDRMDWGDSYLMGDFTDRAGPYGHGAEPTAVIQLHRDGVIESFPLPGGQRRWVVHTGRQQRPERAGDLLALLRERQGERRTVHTVMTGGAPQDAPERSALPELPDPATATMVRSFSVYRQLARRMVAGRTVLIGDAAHAISPIGGQGMTLGWLDALALSPVLADLPSRRGPRDTPSLCGQKQVLISARKVDVAGGAGGAGRGAPASGPLEDRPEFAAWERSRQRAALRAARQAEVNMLLGRPLPASVCRGRDGLARGIMATPLRHRLARLYTMGWAGQP
ncbi:NAD(P)/FAD-dependent oxidoreductase [Citricoccus sp.]|uniref:FAD-dependent oxidoreductase n=1 Tax=Citricoccus sp. TaxID=1978372 RepID=UPI0028BD195F|nr:NAD(P)/FAD-dependent oxidoreductase [Citricoccus sp.]